MDSPKADITIYAWYPRGVEKVIASGGNHFIGLVDENTVLKYRSLRSDEPSGHHLENEKLYRIMWQEQRIGLEVEEQIFGVLGQHHRIIRFKGKHEDGLLLEYMPNGSIADYLCDANPGPLVQERLKWAMQTAEAVAYIHTKGVLHCDVGVGNILLDKDLDIRLCDFQGKLLHPDGTVHLDGGSCENTKSSMPRADFNDANQKTDIFALGSAIYFMMKDHPPFPELDPRIDEEEIESQFTAGRFPALDEELWGEVVQKCWTGKYESADEVVHGLKNINMV
ncbi:hypothetical protein MMC17_005555 [Xylographa soralifera]|nr:hypothetical protein [Xylographa soralifera]